MSARSALVERAKGWYNEGMRRSSIVYLLCAALWALSAAGCGGLAPSPIRTADLQRAEVTGAYTVILYGGRYGDDLESVAILDKEGDQYAIEPYAPAFDYAVMKNVPAQEALARASRHIGWHSNVARSQMLEIVDSRTGALIGYELRPLYMPLAYGASDVLDIDYWMQGDRVMVSVRLIPRIERMRRDGGLFAPLD